MRIIREVCRHDQEVAFCVLRTDTYASTFAHIERLVAAAREDFPDLDPERIEVVKFGGDRYKRTMGIEFMVTVDRVTAIAVREPWL